MHDEYCLQEKKIVIPQKPIPKSRTIPKPIIEWKWELNICHNTDIDPRAYRYIGELKFDVHIFSDKG